MKITMKSTVSTAFLSLVMGICTAAAPAGTPGHEFTVATYNIFYRNLNLPRLAATLRESHADLVALQETNAESEKFLRRELAKEYPHMLFHGGKGSDGFGFMSQTPLRQIKFIDPLPTWRGAWIVEAKLGGTNMQVVSVHLATPRFSNTDSLAGILAAFQQAEKTHATEIARISGELSPSTPAIVLGDFNSFSFFCAPTSLVERGFVDSFASVTANADQQGTIFYRSGENEWRFRIDYIFHTKELRTITSRILKSDASDHFPVVSRLVWNSNVHAP